MNEDIKLAKVAYCKKCEGCMLVAAIELAENDAATTAEFDELFNAGYKLDTIPVKDITMCECPEVDEIDEDEDEEEIELEYPIRKSQSTIYYNSFTVMDELAVKELNELLKLHGAESILAMVKAGKEAVSL